MRMKITFDTYRKTFGNNNASFQFSTSFSINLFRIKMATVQSTMLPSVMKVTTFFYWFIDLLKGGKRKIYHEK